MAIIVDLKPEIMLDNLPPGEIGLSDHPGLSSFEEVRSMGRCETCRHWCQDDDVSRHLSAADGACGECSAHDPRMVAVGFGHGSEGADFITRKDFGCICHSPIPEETKADQ